jgi:Ca2+-transporting ATPase
MVLLATWWGASYLSEGATRAFAFATLVAGNLALILVNRARRGSLLSSLRVPNPTLWLVCAGALMLMSLALYLPWLSGLFKFEWLPLTWLATAMALGLLLAAGIDGLKVREADTTATRSVN